VDIRKAGSGNIGATNVLRVLGKPAGILVLAIDALKGALACWLLPAAAIALAGAEAAPEVEGLRIAAGLAAILGHNYTCWLRFKGGKGIATSAGVLLVWMPAALGLALLVWVLAFLVSGYVSLASVVAAFALPFIVWLTGGSATLIAVAAVLGALAIYKHRSNIQRLRAGTEHRFRRSRTNGAPPA
jgi:glycerol-3-phosphate acyltransferase PlsY